MSDAALPVVAVLATGGTIAGEAQAGAKVGYTAASLSGEQLVRAVPQLQALARIQAEEVASVGSQNMNHQVWWQLLQRVDALNRDERVQAIVITHGTDTLEETAFFLSLAARRDKPLVLVGAMRPATAIGADGPRNLHNAVLVALALRGLGAAYGPVVVMNDSVYGARDVQKMAAGGICAFGAPNGAAIGGIENGHAWFRPSSPRKTCAEPAHAVAQPPASWPRVDIVYAHADMGGDVVDFLAQRVRGLVLAGVGDGNATDAALAALRRAVEQGVAVVRASRTGSGRVGRNGEVDDEGLGFVAAGELNPQKSRILLMLALMAKNDAASLQKAFNSI
jgi:L-asparaginase